MSTTITPAPGERYTQDRTLRKVNGEWVPAVFVVTSLRNGGVYLEPAYETPVKCRPVRWPLVSECSYRDTSFGANWTPVKTQM